MEKKIEMGSSVENPKPKVEKGWSIWLESGIYYKARTVDALKFGRHDYDNAGFEKGIRDCKCGCHMGGFDSGGPVDPFGPCPLNPLPKNTYVKTERV